METLALKAQDAADDIRSIQEEARLTSAPEPEAKALPKAAPARAEGEVGYRTPKIVYGMTAGAFALGFGSGGLALAMAMRANNREQNLGGLPSNDGALADEIAQTRQNSKIFAGVAGSLLGSAALTVGATYLFKRHAEKKRRKEEEALKARFVPLLDAPAP
jgi:hypothetical protein